MERRPLVNDNGEVKELPSGDTLSGVTSVTTWKEPVTAYNNGSPEILFTDTGDAVMNDVT